LTWFANSETGAKVAPRELIAISAMTTSQTPSQLLAGSAGIDITPPLTIPYLGWVPRHAFFEGVHDPLYAKALALDAGQCRVAIVSADSIGFSKNVAGDDRDFVAEVRLAIERECGIPAGNVMLCASHAHSTPETIGIRNLMEHPGTLEWLHTLKQQLVDVVAAAVRNLSPARLKSGSLKVEGIARSRRILGKDGKLYQFRNLPSEEIVADWGLCDSELTVLCFESLGGPRTVLAFFSCHPTTVQVQPLVSADFPGVAMSRVEQALPECENSIFIQGAAGDINPVGGNTNFCDVERYAQILADGIIQQVMTLSESDDSISPCELRVASEVVALPSRELPELGPLEEERRHAEEEVRKTSDLEERKQKERQLHRVTEKVERVLRGNAPRLAEVQVIRIGDCALVGVPGEPFAEMGLAMKELSGPARTLCAGYANDWLGYLAPPSAWELGGYEVSLGTWSIVGPEAHQIVLDTAERLVSQLWG